MPSLKEHIKLSEGRTGEKYRELNEWLDGNGVDFLSRIDRHVRTSKYSRYVEEKWGKRGAEEYRNHVNDDIKGIFLLILRLMRLGKEDDKDKEGL